MPLRIAANNESQDILDVYGELTGRTLLMSARLPLLELKLTPELLANTNRAIAAIETEFARQGLEAIRDGAKFIRVSPAGLQNSALTNYLLRVADSQPAGEVIPKGHVNWSAADLNQVLATYSDISRRTLIRGMSLRSASIRFQNQGSLTISEFLYAIKVILALNGIAVLDDGERFAQVVPLNQAADIKLRAPRPEPSASLIEPRDVPKFKYPMKLSAFLPESLGTLGSENSPRQRREPDAGSLIAYYAELTNSKLIPSEQFSKLPVLFEIKTPVTKTELLYAIEATLAQSALVIVATNNGSIQLRHRSEFLKNGANAPAKRKP